MLMFDNDKHRVLAKNIASQRSIDGTNLSLTMESGHPFNTNACYGHEDGFGRALISGICDIVAMGYNPRRVGIEDKNCEPSSNNELFRERV